MKHVSILTCSLSAVLLGAVVMAQAPPSEADAHVAAARLAAGTDFRNTFLNLCVPAPPGGGRGAAGAPGAAAPSDPSGAPISAPSVVANPPADPRLVPDSASFAPPFDAPPPLDDSHAASTINAMRWREPTFIRDTTEK